MNTYTWNSDNRLTKVETGHKTVTYGYDPQGRRIKKLVTEGANRTETHYVLDTERAYHEIVIERTRTNNDPWQERAYLHTPGGVGELISDSDGTSTRQVYTDGQGSTRLTTDDTDMQSWSFDAFGNLQADSSAPVTHLYTGERYDPDTGLVYLRARDYDPKTGRFISMDEHPGSQRIPLTLNKYLYGNADPVNFIDPSGNFGLGGIGAGASGIKIMASVSMHAMSIYSIYELSSDEEVRDWVVGLIAMMAGGPAGLASSAQTYSPSTQSPAPMGKGQKHHTIPEYLCGHPRQVLSEVPHAEHNAMHKALYGIKVSALFGQSKVLKIFRKPTKKDKNQERFLLGGNPVGRRIISQAIEYVYEMGDWMGVGVLPAGRVFDIERRKFEMGYTSFPQCKKG